MRRIPWRWRLGLLVTAVVAVLSTRGLWLPSVGQSLVCAGGVATAEAMLVENFDPDYRLFERAATLQRGGLAARVFVPTPASARDSQEANAVSLGIVDVMARVARVRNVEVIPIHEIEPYSVNAAYQIRDVLAREHVRSVLVLAPAFRSRRSLLVYRAVFGPAGIQVHCLAIFGQHTPDNWTTTWHGIQVVTEQLVKLGYYRFYFLGRQP